MGDKALVGADSCLLILRAVATYDWDQIILTCYIAIHFHPFLLRIGVLR